MAITTRDGLRAVVRRPAAVGKAVMAPANTESPLRSFLGQVTALGPGEAFGSPADGTKLGGWPSPIQAELTWAPFNEHPAEPQLCIQVVGDQAPGLTPLGSSVLYL